MQKTLYWDIKSTAKLNKVKRKFKKNARVNASSIVRTLIAKTPFETMVEYLNEDMKLVDKLPLNRF